MAKYWLLIGLGPTHSFPIYCRRYCRLCRQYCRLCRRYCRLCRRYCRLCRRYCRLCRRYCRLCRRYCRLCRRYCRLCRRYCRLCRRYGRLCRPNVERPFDFVASVTACTVDRVESNFVTSVHSVPGFSALHTHLYRPTVVKASLRRSVDTYACSHFLFAIHRQTAEEILTKLGR